MFDGVKGRANGWMLYDFIIHSFRTGGQKLSEKFEVKLVHRALFLHELTEIESVEALRATMETALHDRFTVSLEEF